MMLANRASGDARFKQLQRGRPGYPSEPAIFTRLDQTKRRWRISWESPHSTSVLQP